MLNCPAILPNASALEIDSLHCARCLQDRVSVQAFACMCVFAWGGLCACVCAHTCMLGEVKRALEMLMKEIPSPCWCHTVIKNQSEHLEAKTQDPPGNLRGTWQRQLFVAGERNLLLEV